jgi:hypothetical protein
MDSIRMAQITAVGGAVLRKYQRLLALADHSTMGSPNHLTYGTFCQRWWAGD